MDLEAIKTNIVTNVYHIKSDKKVALHKHMNHNELFYCIKEMALEFWKMKKLN